MSARTDQTKWRGVFNLGFFNIDYHTATTSAVPTSYIVGTNKAASFFAQQELIWCDQDAYVVFDDQVPPVFIPANTYMRFFVYCAAITFYMSTVAGTIRFWLEG